MAGPRGKSARGRGRGGKASKGRERFSKEAEGESLPSAETLEGRQHSDTEDLDSIVRGRVPVAMWVSQAGSRATGDVCLIPSLPAGL